MLSLSIPTAQPKKNSAVFSTATINSLRLQNRFVRSAAFENLCRDGIPQNPLIDYHRLLAKNKIALTTVAYASVSKDGLTYQDQINLKNADTYAGLKQLTDEVHREGGAACLQI